MQHPMAIAAHDGQILETGLGDPSKLRQRRDVMDLDEAAAEFFAIRGGEVEAAH